MYIICTYNVLQERASKQIANNVLLILFLKLYSEIWYKVVERLLSFGGFLFGFLESGDFGSSGNAILHFGDLALGASVGTEPVFGEFPGFFLGVVTTTLEDIHKTFLIRSETRDITDDGADKGNLLALLSKNETNNKFACSIKFFPGKGGWKEDGWNG